MTTIINLTPHAVVILPLDTQLQSTTIPAAGIQARISETAAPDAHLDTGTTGSAGVTADFAGLIPTARVAYGAVTGLPGPADGTYYLVSSMVVGALAEQHRGPKLRDGSPPPRTTADLLTPGELVRDVDGRIVGCRYLVRH